MAPTTSTIEQPTSRTYQSAWTPTSGSARAPPGAGTTVTVRSRSVPPVRHRGIDPTAPGRKPASMRWPAGMPMAASVDRVAAATGQEPAERLSCDQQAGRRGDGRSDEQRVALQVGGVPDTDDVIRFVIGNIPVVDLDRIVADHGVGIAGVGEEHVGHDSPARHRHRPGSRGTAAARRRGHRCTVRERGRRTSAAPR